MSESTNSLVESVPSTKMAWTILLLIICFIFENNYIFVENFNTSSRLYRTICETVTIKFGRAKGLRGLGRNMGPRVEDWEKQMPFIFK